MAMFGNEKLCLDRACLYQEFCAHYEHPKDASEHDVKTNAVLTTSNLERLKTERGRRCYECGRFLIPTDGDHTFCDDCWDALMQHEFIADERYAGDKCDDCGKEEDAKIHRNLANAQTSENEEN